MVTDGSKDEFWMLITVRQPRRRERAGSGLFLQPAAQEAHAMKWRVEVNFFQLAAQWGYAMKWLLTLMESTVSTITRFGTDCTMALTLLDCRWPMKCHWMSLGSSGALSIISCGTHGSAGAEAWQNTS
eukprot:202408-Chlamydomonas_euryale.AAC.1